MASLIPGPKGKSSRRLPDGAKEVLQDFVVDVLRRKVDKERFLPFAAEWFQTRLQKELQSSAKLTVDKDKDMPVTPSNIGGTWNLPAPEPSALILREAKEEPSPPVVIEAEPQPTPSTIIDDSNQSRWIGQPPSQYTRVGESNIALASDQPSPPEPALETPAENPTSDEAQVPPAWPPSPNDQPGPASDDAPAPQPETETPQDTTAESSVPLETNTTTDEATKDTLSPPEQSDAASSAISLAPTEAQGASTLNLPETDNEPGSVMNLGEAVAPPATTEPIPEDHPSRRQGVSGESFDPSAPIDETTLPVYPKTSDQIERVTLAINEVLLFRALGDDEKRRVIEALEEFPVEEGADVIQWGDENAEHFYIVDSGNFDCYVPLDGEMKLLTSYEGKGYFGELALMYNQPRAATVKAKTSGMLWRLDRKTFQAIVLRSAYQKREMYKSFMDKVNFLSDLQPYEKDLISDALESRTFQAGEVIIKQGDVGDGMYFVESGEVVCTRIEGEGEAKEVGRCGPGECVGELALIANQPRAATVTAVADGTKLAFLDAKAFERLMGPCIDLLRKRIDKYRETIAQVFGEDSDFLKQ